MLELEDITAGYGETVVLRDVSLSVPDSGVVALLGPNGAGKTTTLRAASGLIKPIAGRVLVDGEDVTGLKPYAMARRGLCHLPEGHGIFPSLTVKENIVLNSPKGKERESLLKAGEQFPVLAARLGQQAGSLSGGEQQMLAIAQALMSEPSVLLLDEPSAGLAPLLVHRTFQVMADLRAQGLTILLVEQIVRQSLAVADTASILVSGRIVLAGDAQDMGARDDLQELYFGDVSHAASGRAPARLDPDTPGGTQ
jgi:branched-chain amino acid transport system ATP-binding protein